VLTGLDSCIMLTINLHNSGYQWKSFNMLSTHLNTMTNKLPQNHPYDVQGIWVCLFSTL